MKEGGRSAIEACRRRYREGRKVMEGRKEKERKKNDKGMADLKTRNK